MVGIIDYGVGNIKSLKNAFKRIGERVVVSSQPAVLNKADLIILPGVGAFEDAMKKLEAANLNSYIQELSQSKKPLLGICLGMQLLYEKSFENGNFKGLGLLKGNIVKFKDDVLKVPHMGWNTLLLKDKSSMFNTLKTSSYVYFVHSYYAKETEQQDILATTHYGVDIPVIVKKGSVLGMQFHPEKSGVVGHQLLKDIMDWVYKECKDD